MMHLHKDESNDSEKQSIKYIRRLGIIFLMLTLTAGSLGIVLGNDTDLGENAQSVALLEEASEEVSEENETELSDETVPDETAPTENTEAENNTIPERDSRSENTGTEEQKADENSEAEPVVAPSTGNNVSADALSDYHAGDVEIINDLIDNNGLGWTKDDPDSWPTDSAKDVNNNPTRSYLTWADVDGEKRVAELIFGDGYGVIDYELTGDAVFTGLDYLTKLNLQGNHLTTIVASGCERLETITASMPAAHASNLKTLDLENCPALQTVTATCSYKLEHLCLSGCESLTTVYAWNCNLKGSLDLSGNTNLKRLEVDNADEGEGASPGTNHLTSIDVSGCVNLQVLTFAGSPLEYLDISYASKITNIGDYATKTNSGELSTNSGEFAELAGTLKEFYAREVTWLKTIYWCDSVIENIDVSGCSALTTMTFDNNTKLSTGSLNMSDCVELTSLSCSGNRLAELNLTNCSALEKLNCDNNLLVEAVVLTDCIALTELSCVNNQMQKLDLSGCSALTTLTCHSNPFRYFSIKGCTKLDSLTLIDGSAVTELPMEIFIARDGAMLEISSDPEGKVWMTAYDHSSGEMVFQVEELDTVSFVDWQISYLDYDSDDVTSKTIAVTMQSETDATLHANFKAAGIYIVEAEDTTFIGRFNELQTAVDKCETDQPYIITATENDELDATVTSPSDKVITLTSDDDGPYTITQTMEVAVDDTGDISNSARHLEIKGEFTLKDIILEGVGYEAEDRLYNGGVYVADGGSLTIEAGASIEKCINSSGGGVYVDGSDAVLNLSGGEITNNQTYFKPPSSLLIESAGYGGGIYLNDGTVNISGGKISNNVGSPGGGISIAGDDALINMSGGVIGGKDEGNTVTWYSASSTAMGGGVYMSAGTFTMTGGEISYNEFDKSSFGGGVLISGGSFEMVDGEISYNEASEGGGVYISGGSSFEMVDSEISCNTAEDGGGVYIADGNFEMEDSEISCNTASVGGGGVYMPNYAGFEMTGSFEMTDSKIADNYAFYYGGGVYIAGTANSLTMTGDSKITGNSTILYGGGIYLDKSSTVNISGGVIENNTADSSGGGIYAASYSYTNPVDTTAYSNLSIDSSVSFSGNTTTNSYYPPVNYLDVTYFDGELLNNKDVNYEGPYAVTYIANNGDNPEAVFYQNADSGQGTEQISVLDNSATGFTAPSDKPNFIGWNTAADGISGTSYAAGQTVDITDSSLVLYAQWEADTTCNVTVEYYTLSEQQEALITTKNVTITDTKYTIDTDTAYSGISFVAWYYTVGPDHDVKYYFKDDGNEYTGIDGDITFKVYAVSTQVDVVIPDDSFFWYANEDTEEQIDVLLDLTSGKYTHLNLNGDEPAYEIRSKAYSIQNNGLTPVTVELADFEQDGSRSEIEDLLDNSAGDMLFLNLTGDLAEEPPLGQDLLRQESTTADPFGVYSESLGAGDSWQYSFGGFYYPAVGHLPGTSAVSDYKLTFNLELDLSDPDS